MRGNQSQIEIKADVCYVRSPGAVSRLIGLHLSLVIKFCPSWWRGEEGDLCKYMSCFWASREKADSFASLCFFLSGFQLKIILMQSSIFGGGLCCYLSGTVLSRGQHVPLTVHLDPLLFRGYWPNSSRQRFTCLKGRCPEQVFSFTEQVQLEAAPPNACPCPLPFLG